jgi:hypothetical protein
VVEVTNDSQPIITHSAVLAAVERVQDALADLESAPHGSEDQGCAADEVYEASRALLHLVDQAATYA